MAIKKTTTKKSAPKKSEEPAQQGFKLTEIARLGGTAYNTIKDRAESWNLKPPYYFHHFYILKPRGGDDVDALTYEEARRRDMAASARLKEIDLETKDKTRIPIETLNKAMAQCFGEIRATIDASKLTQKEKDDICDAIRNAPKALRW